MAPQSVAEVDARYAWDWSKWPVPEMEDVPVEPWEGVPGSFWRDSTDGVAVDEARTQQLVAVDVPIGAHAGNVPWAGSSYGMPYQLIDVGALPRTRVWDQSQPVRHRFSWSPFGWHPVYPIVDVPLPDVVRREGDPGGSSDLHWTGYDPDHAELWEGITLRHPSIWNGTSWVPTGGLQTFGQAEWIAGYNGGGPAFSRWDTSRPWNAKGQPHGVIASATPKFPLVVRWDEIERAIATGDPNAGVGHAVHGVLPNYDRAKVGPARGGDGSLKGHPVRSGEWLRITQEVCERFAPFTPARVIANTLRDHGWRQGDKNMAKDTPAGVGSGGFPLSLDIRWRIGAGSIPALGEFVLRLSDFVALRQR